MNKTTNYTYSSNAKSSQHDLGRDRGSDIESQKHHQQHWQAKFNFNQCRLHFPFIIFFSHWYWFAWISFLFKHMTWNEKSHVSRKIEMKENCLNAKSIVIFQSQATCIFSSFLPFSSSSSSTSILCRRYVYDEWRAEKIEKKTNIHKMLSTQHWIQSIDFLMNEHNFYQFLPGGSQ